MPRDAPVMIATLPSSESYRFEPIIFVFAYFIAYGMRISPRIGSIMQRGVDSNPVSRFGRHRTIKIISARYIAESRLVMLSAQRIAV